MYKATIEVTLRPSILDPQGKATRHALESLGYASVSQVRIGKHIQMVIDTKDEAEARRIAEESCARLLANPVMEDYTVEVEPA